MRFTFVYLLVFAFASHAWAGYRTTKTTDSRAKTVTYAMQDNKLGIPKGEGGCRTDHFSNSVYFQETHVQLLVEKTAYPTETNRPAEFRLVLDYQSDDWFFLKQVTFFIGDELKTLPMEKPNRALDESCHEWASLKVDEAFIKKLAASPVVLIQLQGRDQTLNLCFNDTNRKNLNKFLGESQ